MTDRTNPEAVLARRVDEALAAAMAAEAVVDEIEGFRLYRYLDRHPFYRTLALPRVSEHPPAGCAAALVDRCRQGGIEPRAEFTASRWPGLAEALAAAGLACEADAALMVRRGGAQRPALPADLRVLDRAFEPDAALFLAGLARAGGDPDPTPDEVGGLSRMLASGTARLVLAEDGGGPVAGAALLGGPRVWELAAVWTAPTHRRLGLGTAACARLLGLTTDRGLVWLAALPWAEPLYRRLGFATIGRRLAFGHP